MDKLKCYVICGLGGSGTRLLGNIFHLLGYDLGKDLNIAFDNLDVVRAFNNYTNLKPFEEGEGDYQSFKSKLFPLLKTCYIKEKNPEAIVIKNPNLMYCLRHFKRLGEEEGLEFYFLHLIRDALYMMNNNNKNQLRRWGKYFDLKETTEQLGQIEFWYKANTKILSDYNSLGLNHLVSYYDKIIADPGPEIQRVVDFIGKAYDPKVFKEFIAQIEGFKPASNRGSLENIPERLKPFLNINFV